MNIKKFHIYIADLNPSFRSEPGKIRPVVVIQTDLLNEVHKTTVVCPLTTNVKKVFPLRVFLPAGTATLQSDSDIMVDQIRTIDNHRFKQHLGCLGASQQKALLEYLRYLILE